MNLYLNYFKTEICQNDDNPPIGIVLGAKKDELLLEYALEGVTNQLLLPDTNYTSQSEKNCRLNLTRFLTNIPNDKYVRQRFTFQYSK